jgi:hypothetical protein
MRRPVPQMVDPAQTLTPIVDRRVPVPEDDEWCGNIRQHWEQLVTARALDDERFVAQTPTEHADIQWDTLLERIVERLWRCRDVRRHMACNQELQLEEHEVRELIDRYLEDFHGRGGGYE